MYATTERTTTKTMATDFNFETTAMRMLQGNISTTEVVCLYKDLKIVQSFKTAYEPDLKDIKKMVFNMGKKDEVINVVEGGKKSEIRMQRVISFDEYEIEYGDKETINVKKATFNGVECLITHDGYLLNENKDCFGKVNFEKLKKEELETLELQLGYCYKTDSITCYLNWCNEQFTCSFTLPDFKQLNPKRTGFYVSNWISEWFADLFSSGRDLSSLLNFMKKMDISFVENYIIIGVIVLSGELLLEKNNKEEQKKMKKLKELEERKAYLADLKRQNEEKLKTQQDLINITKEEEELRLKQKEEREMLRLKEEREKQKAEKLERHRLAQEKKIQKKKK